MCTSISYRVKDHYFGRNLDLEYSYHETVAIAPRNKPFHFRHKKTINRHPAIIGMAYVVGDDPLFYEATSESGLSIAGLNFPTNAHYNRPAIGKDNIASYELIPWLLCKCETVSDVRDLLTEINITDEAYRTDLEPATLHWMISDSNESIVFEQTAAGATVYDNPFGVMTNNPTFDYHMLHLCDYMNCSADSPENNLARSIWMDPYSRGMGGMGIPGDLSSSSRFVKAVFTKMNVEPEDTESGNVTQFFKILGSVEQQKGCCRLGKDKHGADICEHTIYSCCCNTDRGIYYYTTYGNSQISCVEMHHEDLEWDKVISFELIKEPLFYMHN